MQIMEDRCKGGREERGDERREEGRKEGRKKK
jgi:hypothetical protein